MLQDKNVERGTSNRVARAQPSASLAEAGKRSEGPKFHRNLSFLIGFTPGGCPCEMPLLTGVPQQAVFLMVSALLSHSRWQVGGPIYATRFEIPEHGFLSYLGTPKGWWNLSTRMSLLPVWDYWGVFLPDAGCIHCLCCVHEWSRDTQWVNTVTSDRTSYGEWGVQSLLGTGFLCLIVGWLAHPGVWEGHIIGDKTCTSFRIQPVGVL